jgi:hypothetical protein
LKPPRVDILYFEGCPNHEAARGLVERVAAELGVDPVINDVEVPDAKTAVRLRFIGSPTVRIDGRDVEPGVEERTDYVLSCRVYRGEDGFVSQPDERWVRAALVEAVREH